LINKRFKKFGTWLSYSYASNEYTFKSLSDINFPNNIDIRHNINIAITHTTENFKFSTGVNWHSGKPTTRPRFEEEIADDGTINYLGPNSDQLEDYFRWDASATYRFNVSKKISGNAGVSAWNILSQENIVNNYYRITPNNGVEEVKQLGLGFTPNIVFRINF